jgi:acyl phosphate:glycerol-3-phosphate acyltransferase
VGLVDIAKGYLAVAVISRLAPFQARPLQDSWFFMASSLAAVLGHIKPVFAQFKGGKGFGTAAGAIMAAFPILSPFCLAIFFITLVLTGYVAVCAAVTSFALPFFYLLATRLFGIAFNRTILVFFFITFALTILGVQKKLRLYIGGKAELFEKVMIIKPKKV